MLGQGKAIKLTASDIERTALELKCHPATIEAISEVESAGSGWFSPNSKPIDPYSRIKILPELHVFGKKVGKSRYGKAAMLGLAYPSYNAAKEAGHYKRMGPVQNRYDMLEKLIKFDSHAAFLSFSSGRYQTMGFNYKACGFKDAEQMFLSYCDYESEQLRGFIGFLKSNNLVTALQNEDFNTIERVYNGGGLNGAYAKRMREYSKVLKSKQWSRWSPTNTKEHVAFDTMNKTVLLKEYVRLLRLGDRGDDVMSLQIELGDTNPDGIFGPGTQSAVIEFQKKHGLKADGVVGRLTHEAIYAE